jgi:hypothetical protein
MDNEGSPATRRKHHPLEDSTAKKKGCQNKREEGVQPYSLATKVEVVRKNNSARHFIKNGFPKPLYKVDQ